VKNIGFQGWEIFQTLATYTAASKKEKSSLKNLGFFSPFQNSARR
jgi:hypothetical protein